MNKVIEKLTKKVVSKPVKYWVIFFILAVYFVIGTILNVSLTILSLTSIGVLIGFIVIDIIQYFVKQDKR